MPKDITTSKDESRKIACFLRNLSGFIFISYSRTKVCLQVQVTAIYNIAAYLRTFFKRSINDGSEATCCMLYLSCNFINESAGTSRAASKSIAVCVVIGRRQLRMSFNTLYEMPICSANFRCDRLRYSISSFNTSPGCVGVYPCFIVDIKLVYL